MNYFYSVGLDVSKLTFEASIVSFDEKEIGYSKFNNTIEGIQSLLQWVVSFKIKMSDTLFCAENMGPYISEVALASVNKRFNLSLICPLTIKKSLGITRGKNDKIDSFRIAYYAVLHHKKLRLYTLPATTISELRFWRILRESLVKQKTSLCKIIEGFSSEKKITHSSNQISFAKNSSYVCRINK